jgi:hypothetical protein
MRHPQWDVGKLLRHTPVRGTAGYVRRVVEVAPQIVELVPVHWLRLWVAVGTWFKFLAEGASCAPWPTKGLN